MACRKSREIRKEREIRPVLLGLPSSSRRALGFALTTDSTSISSFFKQNLENSLNWMKKIAQVLELINGTENKREN